jgi:hypothetical protein
MEYATWVIIAGVSSFVGWAAARSVFLFGKKFIR